MGLHSGYKGSFFTLVDYCGPFFGNARAGARVPKHVGLHVLFMRLQGTGFVPGHEIWNPRPQGSPKNQLIVVKEP